MTMYTALNRLGWKCDAYRDRPALCRAIGEDQESLAFHTPPGSLDAQFGLDKAGLV